MCRLSSRFNCGCCGDSVDYPVLAQMRSTRLIAVDEEKDEEKSEEVDVGDEDLDFDFDDDGIMDSMRQQMAAQIEQVEHLRQEAAVLGFVQHREDSAEHLIGYICHLIYSTLLLYGMNRSIIFTLVHVVRIDHDI